MVYSGISNFRSMDDGKKPEIGSKECFPWHSLLENKKEQMGFKYCGMVFSFFSRLSAFLRDLSVFEFPM